MTIQINGTGIITGLNDNTIAESVVSRTTPAQFDNDTSFATTEFVQNAIGNVRGVTATNTAGGISLTSAHVGNTINLQVGFTGTVTLPPASGLVTGASLTVWNGSGAARTVVPSGTDTLWPSGSSVASLTMQNGDTMTLVLYGSAWLVISGATQLKYAGVFQSSLSANGYQKLPSGLIIEWGTFTTSGTQFGAVVVNYPLVFPNNIFSIAATVGGGSQTVTSSVWTDTFTSTSCNFRSNVISQACRYIAIGY